MSADVVNLRTARKRAQRGKDEKEANAKRLTHGTPKTLQREAEARRDKAARELDGHRRDPADE